MYIAERANLPLPEALKRELIIPRTLSTSPTLPAELAGRSQKEIYQLAKDKLFGLSQGEIYQLAV